MPGLFEWWYRFRKVAKPPGTPATRASVPADVNAARAAELAPVFAHVDGLEAELSAREAAAEVEAESIAAAAERDATLVVAHAREGEAAIRADAGARRQRDHDAHARELHDRSEREAAEIKRRGDESIPALVNEAVARVRAFASAPVDAPDLVDG